MKTIEQMPDDARVWLYQADVFLTPEQEHQILGRLEAFIAQWTSHGALLEAAVGIYHRRIVVIAADEQMAAASGCGIDKSVRFMQDLTMEMNIDFFQRTVVLYQVDGTWKEAPIHQFWAMRKAGNIGDDTIVLDSTVRKIAGLKRTFTVPFGQSWHAEMWSR